METLWTQASPTTFTTTVSKIEAAGGRRKVTLPTLSNLRVGDLIWTPDVQGTPSRWEKTLLRDTLIIFNI